MIYLLKANIVSRLHFAFCLTHISERLPGKINQKALYNLFAASLHAKPPEEPLERAERERRDAQLRILIWSLVRE
jgi:hypothetical protein